MKVFADECVNRELLRHLAGHTFVHSDEMKDLRPLRNPHIICSPS